MKCGLRGIIAVAVALLATAGGCPVQPEDTDSRIDVFADARRGMVEHDIRGRGVSDPAVLAAMAAVPRHVFVPPSQVDQAYGDHPLPIGGGQTISQPYIVAAMTELVAPKPGHIVLEIGTGSGYQAAILARLVKHVYTIEIVEPLARSAATRLADLGCSNVTVRAGDGYAGWPEHAPFDGIVVTCGAEKVPPPLVAQLKPGGRMVIPVGPSGGVQDLLLIEKDAAGRVSRHSIMAVRFVPLTGPSAR